MSVGYGEIKTGKRDNIFAQLFTNAGNIAESVLHD